MLPPPSGPLIYSRSNHFRAQVIASDFSQPHDNMKFLFEYNFHHLVFGQNSSGHKLPRPLTRRKRAPTTAMPLDNQPAVNRNKMAKFCSNPRHCFPRLFLATTLITCLILLPTPSNKCDAQSAGQISATSVFLQPPVFVKSMDSLTIKENTQLNEIVYTLEAQLEAADLQRQPQQQSIRMVYGIEGTNLFSVDRLTGQVRVSQPIDREQTNDSIALQVSATPYYPGNRQAGPPARLSITVFVLDENDNAPKIERVRVGRHDYSANQLTKLTHSVGLFATQQQQARPTPIIRLNVSENTPTDSNIVDLIEATDVDKASSNPLSAICLDCEPEFELRPITENLLNDRLDWSIVLVRQLIHVPRQNVRQLHVIVNDGKFNSSIVFEITIDDVQNRPPQFVGSTSCVVRENVAIDKVIMTLQAVDGDALALDDSPQQVLANSRLGGRQIVFDFLNSNNQSSSFQDDFKLNPLTGQLRVANRLDREAHLDVNGVLTFRVRARELTVDAETVVQGDDNLYETILNKLASFIDQSPEAATLVDITIILMDVNDNEPHWLNSSEISALNLNQSPVWHENLPLNDRDTGRNYRLQVPENLAPGSAISMKNGMFVYDLDNGENAQFAITLKDPFNLFDVEPKRVNGFGMITLKLTSNSSRPKLLDYENINERSYIIQLWATETSTDEHFSSKAQVQINVLDVNDNAPEFKESTYLANIREDVPPGKTVKLIQATDRDEVSRQITYSLHGKSAYLFDINPQTGLISVAKCEPSPPASSPLGRQSGSASGARLALPAEALTAQASRPCLDYELQRAHHLMVEATDGELSSKVPLTVYVEDASDNSPVFSLPIIDVVIEEGSERLDPPIKIEASDADQTSVLSYSIVEGNFEGLFAINNITGELQLTRPIRIAHDDLSASSLSGGVLDYRQQQLNKMTLIVQATDGHHAANGTVRVDILDANDNAPKFSRGHYEKDIPESAERGQHVLTVRAFDLDRGNNARVSYRLERGSHNQFEINETSGEITVAANSAPFDASKRENYTLEVVAYDHGSISKSSSVLVHLRVLATNRKSPEFQPQIQRATIHENTLNNTIIHRMVVGQLAQLTAPAPDQSIQTTLIFEPGPIEGLDKYGQPVVDIERLESMFSVSTNTGDVAVNSNLDHDFVSYVNLTVYAALKQLYSAANADNSERLVSELPSAPRSTGYLLINVVDDNNNPPVFGAPWSPSQPELTFQMQEELPVGSTLTQLVASDADSRISHYKIDPPNEYFELASTQSGVIVNKKLIDYDASMRQTFLTPSAFRSHQQPHSAQLQQAPSNNIIQFNVFAFDSGQPQLSAKAIVSVEILPVNDWDCKFEQQLYELHVKENPQPDTVIAQVRANDLDFGEQHNSISYSLVGDSEYRDCFNVDARTGVVTVSNRGSLELDRERLRQPTIVLTVVGRNNEHQKSATQQDQTKATAQQQSVRSCSATIKIHVEDVNDNPPLFSQKLYEVSAYDTDTTDVPLVKLMVRDEDTANNIGSASNQARVAPSSGANSFRILAGNVNDSFNITPSGLIYATKPLGETFASLNSNGLADQRQPIQLRVQVKQQTFAGSGQNLGVPTMFTDECLVRINLLKINRVAPEWRPESIKSVTVEENKRPGTLVTQLKCTDRDLDASRSHNRAAAAAAAIGEQELAIKPSSSPIRYWIKENGSNVLETNEFKLDSITGNLVTRVELDRETQQFHQLIVSCEDNGKLQSLESIVPLYISVLDVDDNKPEFLVPKNQQQSLALSSRQLASGKSSPSMPTMKLSVEEQQGKGMPVGELKAIDRDLESRYPIAYCIVEGNEFQEFSLDRITGVLYTNQTLDRERQSAYELLVIAVNDGSTCEQYANRRGTKTNTTVHGLVADMGSEPASNRKLGDKEVSSILVLIEVLDMNDNAPLFKRHVFRAGAHHRSLMNTLVTQVAAFDPDLNLNGSSSYKISEILMYKTNNQAPYQSGSQSRKYNASSQHHPVQEQSTLSKPIKLIQFPFRIDQQGNVYTQQLLTQYQLMSMFVLQIEATEQAEPWRTATTKLEIYLYETNNQLKIRLNLHPRLVEAYRHEIESMLSNSTGFTAIINRAKSYHGNNNQQYSTSWNAGPSALGQQRAPTLDLSSPATGRQQSNLVVPLGANENEPNFSNILAVFVDHYKIVNPNVVMERFDLTSAQLFTPQMLLTQRASSFPSNLNYNQQATGHEDSGQLAAMSQEYMRANSQQSSEFSSLIDKIALASVQASSDQYNSNPSLAIGIDWLESPSVLFVCSAGLLALIGLIICITGCCCTSRIKDHIIKVAMDKLVKQQTLQAKINERVLAATNQAYANSTINGAGLHNNHHQDYIMQQGGLMSSFDATKGCMNNNYENMSILQRAMDAGEFIDSNYTTLNNVGHMNLGAHYYDASELEHEQNLVEHEHHDQQLQQMQEQEHQIDMDDHHGDKQFHGSTNSLSAADEITEELTTTTGADLNNGHHEQPFVSKAKLYSNGLNGIVSSNRHQQQQQQQRRRQQVPVVGNCTKIHQQDV